MYSPQFQAITAGRDHFTRKTKGKENDAETGMGSVSCPRHPSSHGAACGGEGSVEGKKNSPQPHLPLANK